MSHYPFLKRLTGEPFLPLLTGEPFLPLLKKDGRPYEQKHPALVGVSVQGFGDLPGQLFQRGVIFGRKSSLPSFGKLDKRGQETTRLTQMV